jgi:hypothetical protein
MRKAVVRVQSDQSELAFYPKIGAWHTITRGVPLGGLMLALHCEPRVLHMKRAAVREYRTNASLQTYASGPFSLRLDTCPTCNAATLKRVETREVTVTVASAEQRELSLPSYIMRSINLPQAHLSAIVQPRGKLKCLPKPCIIL